MTLLTLLHAELRKLLTLPSLRLTVLLTVAVALLLASLDAAQPVRYVQAGFLVLGVLATASEHQGGDQIRATLLAMPRRLPLYAAKVVALAAVTLPVAALVALHSTTHLTLTTLLAAAAGTLVRRAEAAVVLLLVVYYVGPLLRTTYAPDTTAVATGTLLAVAAAAYVFHRRDA
ncbi:hypothetical protein [Dactylosporangium sp. NPDC050588]|uniref:hypothetical protein n=1 Tax=Dactylosporangium sp. NPDC050588 TaxID=3157211 RepID=UPI0033DC3BF3